MCVALDYGHGNNQASVGHIPGQHMIFGVEERWWYSTHVRPGDRLTQERIFTGTRSSQALRYSSRAIPSIAIYGDFIIK